MNTIYEGMLNRFKSFLRADFIILAVFTAVLILASFIIFSISARSFGPDDNNRLNEFYSPLEERYVAAAREYLDDAGYVNSGVSLTHTTDGNLNRIYTLKVHHRRLDGLSDKELKGLTRDLYDLGFSDDRCTIKIIII